ncbi:MAG: hypothetical protein WCA79_21075 [Anaerolineales bacterium]
MQNKSINKPSSDSTTSQTEADSEIQEYLSTSECRRRLFPRAALVGLGAGLVAALFRATLNEANAVRNQLLIWAHHFPVFGWFFPILFSMAGSISSLWLPYTFKLEMLIHVKNAVFPF